MNRRFWPPRNIFAGYQLTPSALAARAARTRWCLHPGPMIRGLEIDSAVADGPQSRRARTGDQRPRRSHGAALPSHRRRAGGRAPSRKGTIECF